MKNLISKFIILFLASSLFALNVSAQEEEATTLEELLVLVEQAAGRDAALEAERMRVFMSDQDAQTQLLADANAERTRQENLSTQLEDEFEANELLLADVQEQLDTRLGSLREIFGVLQQVAGDARAQFQNSLTNIEFPDRGDFLTELAAKMGSTSQLASIEEIERLWFELQREATELGKVKLIPNFELVTADGELINENIVRVGAFNIAANGRYLQHNSATNSVSELQRQPEQSRFTNSTSDLLEAVDGFAPFGLDPTRGVILAAFVQSPNLRERVGQGGLVGYVILCLGAVGVLIALERLVSLTLAGQKVKAQLKSSTPDEGNALGRVLKIYNQNPSADVESLELKLGEAILKEMPPLQRGILFIKVISVVAPLMGLLGTVTGMINTFQAITLFGTGDPRTMAGGISQALVTTVLGLVVAIPTVLLHTIVSGRSKSITQVLQEQSAGLVARRAEGA
ncbi:MAG: MotA/TolQ/ExbB proton channel family protein [Gammaproteobacteria bacterium]